MSGPQSTSPRASPLLQFFSSSASPGTGAGGGGGGTTSPRASPTPGDDAASNASSLIRSLSKCFDAGVSMEEAVLDEEGKKGATDKANKGEKEGGAGAPKWGPSHSVCSDDPSNKPQNKAAATFGKLFKASPPSPSKGSQGNNSGKTDPTAPVTMSTGTGNQTQTPSQLLTSKTGMSAAPTTPGGNSNLNSSMATSTNVNTTAAMGSTSAAVASFWKTHALPATACSGEGNDYAASSTAGPQNGIAGASGGSPLSHSARAAADAVMGMISKAEELLTSTSAGSAVSGREGGLCSPRSSPRSNDLAMEGIPEETPATTKGECDNICGRFEFEEFGFNAFQGNNNGNPSRRDQGNSAGGEGAEKERQNGTGVDADGFPTQTVRAPSPEPEQPKGYEIRLKSSFSQAQAMRDRKKEQGRRSPTMGAFGRTHPNNKQEQAYQNLQQHSQRHINDANEGETGSRALPDGLPFRELSVPSEIERTVSELTMRSHGVDRHKHSNDSRRMAYYAVGRAAANSSDDGGKSSGGGNRRCYFTGAPIPYGAPFYAGSVQQGPRTLVVFCLPSALGLPKKKKKGGSLPDPDDELLKEMGRRYPGPFDTLPAQVRSSHCWRLFVKFCFFSGLPIAEGEMHYRVKANVRAFPPSSQGSQTHQEEEIALSHEVMEAVNGEVSAEILRLPNQNLFDYLRRQYSQQSSKLSDDVFVRSSWEMVRPEV
ncbi:hypothetical protein ACHAXT_010899 [Thalassiosira profunda]